MKKGHERKYRVSAYIYPTPHNKIWVSSGCVPLYNNFNNSNFINFPVKNPFNILFQLDKGGYWEIEK